MNKKDLKEFIENYWEDVADDIEEVMVAGLHNSVDTGEICVSAEVVSNIARQGIMRLIDQYEMTLPLDEDNRPSERKYLYLLYDLLDKEIIYQSSSKEGVYLKLGEMCAEGRYIDETHVIAVDLERVEE